MIIVLTRASTENVCLFKLATSNSKPLVNKKQEIWSEDPIVPSVLSLPGVKLSWPSPDPAQCQWLLNILKHHSRFQPESGSTVKFNVLGIFDNPPTPHLYFYRHSNNVSGFLYSFKWTLTSHGRESWKVKFYKIFFLMIFIELFQPIKRRDFAK